MSLLLELLAKSVAIFAAASVILLVWRGASASQRRLVWLAAFAATLLLPATHLIPFRWAWKLDAPKVVRLELDSRGDTQPAAPATPGAQVAANHWRTPGWRHLTLGAWIGGSLLILGVRLLGSVHLYRLQSRSALADVPLRLRGEEALRGIGLKRPVEFRVSRLCNVPMTWGSWHPVILLPSAAGTWPTGQLTAAVRHEAAHILHGDYLARWLAHLACAFYWPNPLVWMAARALRSAQEQSCDDFVLRKGTPPADYAALLLEAARALSGGHRSVACAIAMARASGLEHRITGIVDAERNRQPLNRSTTTMAFACVLAVLTLAGVARVGGADTHPAGQTRAGEIQIEARFFELDSALVRKLPKLGAPATAIAETRAAELVAELSNSKGVDLMSAPRLTVKTGKKGVISITREFLYPTDWKRNPESGAWEPTAHDKKQIGLSLGAAGVPVKGGLEVELELEVVEFQGFVDLDAPGNSPDKASAVPAGHRAKAIFATYKASSRVKVGPGESVLMEIGPKASRRQFALVKAVPSTAAADKPGAEPDAPEANLTAP